MEEEKEEHQLGLRLLPRSFALGGFTLQITVYFQFQLCRSLGSLSELFRLFMCFNVGYVRR